MPPDERNQPAESSRRLQFSLLALLGVVTGCGVVLGLVAWIGPDSVGAAMMIGGFCLVLIGNWLRSDRLIVCGGVAMMVGCLVLMLLGLARVVYS